MHKVTSQRQESHLDERTPKERHSLGGMLNARRFLPYLILRPQQLRASFGEHHEKGKGEHEETMPTVPEHNREQEGEGDDGE